MEIGLNTLYNTGTPTYTIPLNDKEVLVLEEDELRTKKLSDTEKLDKEIQKEKEEKKKKELSNDKELTPEEEEMVKELQARDAEVKAHEAAHQAAGGGMTGAASFTYQQGPDGKMYAIGGEVSITARSGATPEESIAIARQMAAAAMAPGDPSPQDHSVAASARVMEMKAQQQLAREKSEEIQEATSAYKQNSSQDENSDSYKAFDISA